MGRRIDLIMNASNLELSSFEWKRVNARTKVGEAQQIKNIRTNAAVYQNLGRLPLNNIMKDKLVIIEMDWIGIVVKRNF